MACHWAYRLQSRAGPMSWTVKPAQNRLMFYCMCICSVWFGFFFFCLTDFLLFSQVLFVFDRRRERGRERTKLSGEGGGEEI